MKYILLAFLLTFSALSNDEIYKEKVFGCKVLEHCRPSKRSKMDKFMLTMATILVAESDDFDSVEEFCSYTYSFLEKEKIYASIIDELSMDLQNSRSCLAKKEL